jgi:ATP-binding cassette subfamily B protein
MRAQGHGAGGHGGGAFERPTVKTVYILRRLWKYLYSFKWLLLLALLLSVISNLLALVGPKLSGYAVDAIAPGVGKVDFPAVYRYAVQMIAFYLISSLFSYFLAGLMIRLSRNVVYSMSRDAFNKLT